MIVFSINIDDCGTENSITVTSIIDGGEIIQPLTDRILGRVIAEPILDSDGNELYAKDTMLDEDAVDRIESLNLASLKVRSPMTCEASIGVCSKCYGRDLARGHLVHRGEAIGVVAAQSIGEPGTQLTMRTFHIGGAASSASEDNAIFNKNDGVVTFRLLRFLPRHLRAGQPAGADNLDPFGARIHRRFAKLLHRSSKRRSLA